MNAEQVRAAFAALPDLPASDDFWDVRRAGLRLNAAREPLEAFLTWPAIVGTMFVGQPEWVLPELTALEQADAARWGAVTAGEYGGAPNTNLIHQAYHLHQWERATGVCVSQLGSIVEVGGGYGALAVVARRAGFAGRYTIYDLPELSLLQSYYLAQMGAAAECRSELNGTLKADLLVAIYSLSETTAATVAAYLDAIHPAHYLIGLKRGPWQGEDLNLMIERRFPWSRVVDMPHDPGSYYLMG